MKAPADCRLIGRWRIVEADLWDRDYLDLCGPATLTVTAQGGEIAFGAMGQARCRIRPRLDRLPLGRMRRRRTQVEAKEPPNSSTTARSRSNSPTTTAMKPSSKQNETILQQPARTRTAPFSAQTCTAGVLPP